MEKFGRSLTFPARLFLHFCVGSFGSLSRKIAQAFRGVYKEPVRKCDPTLYYAVLLNRIQLKLNPLSGGLMTEYGFDLEILLKTENPVLPAVT
jgi:hypothetical protein